MHAHITTCTNSNMYTASKYRNVYKYDGSVHNLNLERDVMMQRMDLCKKVFSILHGIFLWLLSIFTHTKVFVLIDYIFK